MNFIPAKDTYGSPANSFVDGLGLLVTSERIISALLAVLIIGAVHRYVTKAPGRNSRSFRPRRGSAPFRLKPAFRPKSPSVAQSQSVARSDMANPANQMDAIARVQFERVRLLNKEEARLLPVLEQVVRSVGRGHRVMAQTSLGEIIKPKPSTGSASELKNAYASINSKRFDFALFDRSGFMACAIEYQGSGHHQSNAFMRDAVKKEALRRANVPLVEVSKSFVPEELQVTLRRILEPAQPGSQHGHSAVHM